jgi:hypothetical protein
LLSSGPKASVNQVHVVRIPLIVAVNFLSTLVGGYGIELECKLRTNYCLAHNDHSDPSRMLLISALPLDPAVVTDVEDRSASNLVETASNQLRIVPNTNIRRTM